MSKTYKELVTRDFPRLKALNAQLRNNIEELQNVLLGNEMPDPIKYRAMEEKLRTFEYALQNIRYTSNAATSAWDIADSVLRKYE